MLVNQLAFILCLMSFPTMVGASETRATAAPELLWARDIATDFFDAVLGGDGIEAVGLLTPELAKSLGKVYNEDIPVTYFRIFIRQRYVKATIVTDELAFDKSEAIIKGKLAGKDAQGEFTLRVARDIPGGKWSIRFLRIKELPRPTPKPEGE